MLSLLWIGIVWGFFLMVPLIVLGIAGSAIAVGLFGAVELQFVGVALVGIWGVFYLVSYCVCFQTAVLQGERGYAAMQASYRLIRHPGGGIFGCHAARAVIVLFLVAVGSLLVGWVRVGLMQLLWTVFPDVHVGAQVGSWVTVGASILAMPIVPTLLTVFYHDLLCRRAASTDGVPVAG